MSGLLCQSNYCRPADFGGPRQVEPGRPLCRTCADRLGPTLRRIAGMWPDLRARLAIEGTAGEKVTGTKTPGLVINEEVSTMSTTLQMWADAVVRRVRSQMPSDRPVPDGLRAGLWAGPILAWLGQYHAWRLAYDDDHEWAVYVVENAEWFRREVRRLAYPSGTRRVFPRDARCLAVVLDPDAAPDDGTLATRECGGQLYALIHPADTGLPAELVCVFDDTHRVPSKQWLTWARRGVRNGHRRDRRIPDGGGDRARSGLEDQNGIQPGK